MGSKVNEDGREKPRRKTSDGSSAKSDRYARQAKALRENLKKRVQQRRKREALRSE